MPQFDIMCFGTLVWSLLFIFLLLYIFSILKIIPLFSEIKKLRLKKNNDNIITRHSILINTSLKYNLKLKKFI
nr:ATPase subunit 8 [Stephanopyxis turris]